MLKLCKRVLHTRRVQKGPKDKKWPKMAQKGPNERRRARKSPRVSNRDERRFPDLRPLSLAYVQNAETFQKVSSYQKGPKGPKKPKNCTQWHKMAKKSPKWPKSVKERRMVISSPPPTNVKSWNFAKGLFIPESTKRTPKAQVSMNDAWSGEYNYLWQ